MSFNKINKVKKEFDKNSPFNYYIDQVNHLSKQSTELAKYDKHVMNYNNIPVKNEPAHLQASLPVNKQQMRPKVSESFEIFSRTTMFNNLTHNLTNFKENGILKELFYILLFILFIAYCTAF